MLMAAGISPPVVYPASEVGSQWPVPTWNLRHRGAKDIFAGLHLTRVDDRRDYGRPRFISADLKRLRGLSRPQYRLRVDEYRVYYDVVDRIVEVLAIMPKSETDSWLARFGKPAQK